MSLGKKLSLLVAVSCVSLLSYSQVSAQESTSNTISQSVEYGSRVINNGWVESNGNWYYYQNNTKQVGWIQVSGTWYYTNPSGVMQTGWLNLHGTWYYLESNGAMQTNWLNLRGAWYYLGNYGVMQTGWFDLQGTWYHFNSNGLMSTNTVIDGWNIAANGVATRVLATDFSEYQKEVLRLVNIERKNNKLSPLTLNTKLSNVATIKSQDMVTQNYFDHASPTYGSPFDMMKEFGIKYWTAAENIAMGYISPERVVVGWMNSPGHKKNILNSKFTELGVGIAKSDNGVLYWTQMFIGK